MDVWYVCLFYRDTLFVFPLLTICFYNDIAPAAHTSVPHRDGGYHEASSQIQFLLCRQARQVGFVLLLTSTS